MRFKAVLLTVKQLKGGKWTLIYTNAPASRWFFFLVGETCIFFQEIQHILFSLQGLSRPYTTLSMYGIFSYIWLILMVNVGKYTSPMDGIGMMKGKEMTGRRQGTGTLGYLTYATVDGQNLLVSHYLKRYRYALLITGAPGFCTATQRCGWQVAHSPALHILTICLKVPVSKRVLITFDYCRRTVRACINYLDLFETTQLYLKALQDRVPFNQIKYGIKKTW